MIDRITICKGDITRQTGLDAIITDLPVTLKIQSRVNKALLAASPQLDDLILEHIFQPKAGDVFALPGLSLPAKHILFVMTPPWKDGGFDRAERDLIACYRNSVEAAVRMELSTLAFPAIATGKRNGYPAERAARLAFEGLLKRVRDPVRDVRIVCDQDKIYDVFAARRQKLEDYNRP